MKQIDNIIFEFSNAFVEFYRPNGSYSYLSKLCKKHFPDVDITDIIKCFEYRMKIGHYTFYCLYDAIKEMLYENKEYFVC